MFTFCSLQMQIAISRLLAALHHRLRIAKLAAARDFVSGIIDLLTDTDATHDLVRRQLRDTWPSLIQERYHRLDAVIDARHLGLAEGDAECLRDLRAMALDYIKRERGLEWRHLVDALRRRSGGGTQRVYAVVDLDEESMQVAKPHRAGLMRPVRKKFARDGAARLLLEEGPCIA